VRVSSNGEAVIRVRAPSTYFVWRYIAIPHIRLRVCKAGVNIKHRRPDATLYFGLNETWVKPHTIQVSTARPYANRVAQPYERPRGPQPVARIVAVRSFRGPLSPTTTTTVRTLSTSEKEVMINASRDALSLAALEFSPIYECFLLGLFFDHFSEDCVMQCPKDSEVVHGQCSRPIPEAAIAADITAVWKLEVACSELEACLPDLNTTLHMARLAVASHLDIPFQEVRVSISFTDSSSRRLSQVHPNVQNVYFEATVSTRRVSQAYGGRLLDMLIADVEFSRELLGGVDIRRIEILGSSPPGQQRIMEMSEVNDPYAPAYEDLQPRPDQSSVLGFLPREAVIPVAVGIIISGVALITVLCLWNKRKMRQAREMRSQERAQEKMRMDSIDENGKKANAVETNDEERASNNVKIADQGFGKPKWTTQEL